MHIEVWGQAPRLKNGGCRRGGGSSYLWGLLFFWEMALICVPFPSLPVLVHMLICKYMWHMPEAGAYMGRSCRCPVADSAYHALLSCAFPSFSPAPSASATYCGSPSKSYYSFSCSSYYWYSGRGSCSASCQTGYVASGSTYGMCNSNGIWSYYGSCTLGPLLVFFRGIPEKGSHGGSCAPPGGGTGGEGSLRSSFCAP